MRRFANHARLLATALICCAAVGCAQWPRIDPSGERIFLPHGQTNPIEARQAPGAQLPGDNIELLLSPRLTVAPVGSEVVLQAGVLGPDGYLRTNERVEWSIAPGSAGEILDFNRAGVCDVLVGDFNRPRRVTNTFAIGSTSRESLVLTRGTPTRDDDVLVHAGQTWITVASAMEGTSYVTAYAPDVYGWDRHRQTSTIHWIDAEWRLPPPAINAAGSRHVLVTSVARHTDHAPRAGWRVQYSITGGPPGGFAPDGSQTIEVETDPNGEARAEILQSQPAAGTNTVAARILRPALQPGSGPLVVGSGITTLTWSAPGIVLRTRGPAVAGVGATLTYRIEITNSGDQPAESVVITDELPPTLTHLQSTPASQTAGRALRWELGRLSPGECRYVEINVRADQIGTVTHCAAATAAGGLQAQDCTTTNVSLTPPASPAAPQPTTPPSSPLSLRVTSPPQVTVGDEARFEIAVTNVGQSTLSGLVIRDVLGPGLSHPKASADGAIRRSLRDLIPGDSERVLVVLRAEAPGRLCHNVEVTAEGGLRATAEACVVAAPSTMPGSSGSPTPAPPPGAAQRLSIRITPPPTATQGQAARFLLDVTNLTPQPLTDVRVRSSFDRSMELRGGTEQLTQESDGAAVWAIPSIAARQTLSIGIEFLFRQPSARACLTVQAISRAGVLGQQEACVAIRANQPGTAGPSPLEVSVIPSAEPVDSGRELTYTIEITNRGTAAQSQVALAVTLPAEMLPVRLYTTGPTLGPATSGARRPEVSGNRVIFEPVAQLAPGQIAQYRLRAQARSVDRPTRATVVASVSVPGLAQPLTREVQTTINPASPQR